MDHELTAENDARSMMSGSYNDSKLDKSQELNETMTISESPSDEYTNTIHNIGGGN